MKSLPVRIDEPTYRALSRFVPLAGRKRAEFVRNAIRKAIREAQYDQIRKAYQVAPDTEAEADDWTTAEEFNAETRQ